MRRREFIAGLGSVAAWPLAARAQQFVGAWRATNQCFLAAFILMEGGRAQAAYLSGDGTTMPFGNLGRQHAADHVGAFPLDLFTE
jgi:hypothetical protein